MEWLLFLGDCVVCASIIAFILSLRILVRTDFDDNFKFVFSILLMSAILEVSTSFIYNAQDYLKIVNVLGLYNLYYIISYTLWFMLYYQLIKHNVRRFIPYLVALYLISCFVEAMFFLDYTQVNQTYPHTIGSLCLAVVIIFYFVQILQDGSFEALKDNFYFWISCGLLIYYVGSLPFRVVTNYFTFISVKNVDLLFFNSTFIFGLIMYLLFSIGLYRYKFVRIDDL